MILTLIIVCEIGFWLFVIAGLIARYIFKQRKIGACLLACTPIIDLILIVVTVVDLKGGETASFFHGLAAVYVGVTIAFGHRMIQWADRQFAYRFSTGSKPVSEKKYGKLHAKEERGGWYRHLAAWGIGSVLLILMIWLVGNPLQTKELRYIINWWLLVLGIDFIISFSYTLWPKKQSVNRN